MKHSPGFLKLIDEAKHRVREISIEVTRTKLLSGFGGHLFDIREDNEWEAGHIADAEHLGKGIIERDIESVVPDKHEEIILYCGGGYRSILAADALQKMGYDNVHSMSGGWRGWVGAGLPTSR